MGTTETMTSPIRQKLVDDAVFAVFLLVFAESMLFAGLISAFQIVKNSVTGGIWPPPGQPRLPVEATGLNTLALLASGVFLVLAWRAFQSDGAAAARRRFEIGAGLGALFVIVQGAEWVTMLAQGLTITSSQLGGFFYLIVGCHALHALAGLAALAWVYRGLRDGTVRSGAVAAATVFWGFVVLMWPPLYLQVYL